MIDFELGKVYAHSTESGLEMIPVEVRMTDATLVIVYLVNGSMQPGKYRYKLQDDGDCCYIKRNNDRGAFYATNKIENTSKQTKNPG